MPRYASYGARDSQVGFEQDTFFLTMNSRLRPDQLKAGELAMSVNGRMGTDGAWQPRPGIDHFGPTIGTSSSALILPFYLYETKIVNLASRSTTTVTMRTSTAHGFTSGTQVGIQGFGGTVSPNGNQTITVIDADEFSFEIAGATGSESYSTSSDTKAGAPYVTTSNNFAYGSCLFSDPSDSNDEYIILAQNANAVAVDLVSGSTTTIAYPTGVTISSTVNMLQAFGKVYIFRDGATALEWNGSFSGSPAFSKVANGTYTQPKILTASNNASASGGVVTIAETAHGLVVGDTVKIMDKGSSPLVNGTEYKVATRASADAFTFFADVDDFSSTSVVLGSPQSVGKGYSYMPAPPWAIYHQRRFWCPFAYTTTGSSGSETVATRNITDELIASDIGDPETYDQLVNIFRVTNGTADYLQSAHPFAEDNLVVFNRNSIHLISGISGAIDDARTRLVTAEVGLLARRSVVTIGSRIFFLSDNGVYAVEFGDLYNLRGAGQPLSDAIDPIIKRINTTYAKNAVAAYHDNRYWLAVPLDSSTGNNALLVYNTLNGGWESVDLISSSQWDVRNLITAGSGSINKLYAINSNGGVHIVDGRVDDADRLQLYPGISPASQAVASYATTRAYTMGSGERKKFTVFEAQLESTESNASDGTLSVESENLDEAITLGTVSSFNGSAVLPVGEDVSLRGRIGGIRAYGLQLTLTPSQGRPKLRSVRVEGIGAFKQTTSAS